MTRHTLCKKPWQALVSCLLLMIGCLVTGGCSTWHLSSHLPGTGLTKSEKQIVDRVENDPFPSPDQVGIRSE